MDARAERRLAEFRGYIAEGLDDAQMIERSGLSVNRARHWRRTAGVILPSGVPVMSDADKARAHDLALEGYPASEIGSILGWSAYTIAQHDTTGLLSENGNAMAGVTRWARKFHPELLDGINRQQI